MRHLSEDWFINSLEAHNKGKGHIYAFNSYALRERHKKFLDEKRNEIEVYTRKFEPNPFVFQYDLLVYCWVNFKQIISEEVKILRQMAKDNFKPSLAEMADSLMQTNTLYGIERADFMFGAIELRWPTTKMGNGYRGPVVRDPWMERRTRAFSDQKKKYLASFGGGGQGKTLTFIALNLIIWDYYIFTQKGARCMISTVNKDKLESASWPYLQQLVASTERDISLYAGKGIISADHTLKRPSTKDTAGVFKGVLLGERLNDSGIIDKLTGAHGHPFVGYLMDEAQSTPIAPISAAGNYTMHAKDFRISMTGNYNEDSDTLGSNVKPTGGWDTVDENTGEWMSYTVSHQPCIVLHFSNNNSPGMTKEGNEMFPHMPSKKMLDEKYPKASSRTIDNKQYRRFWIGWRTTNIEGDTVLVKSLVEGSGCSKNLNLSSVTHKFMSFDSAQSEGDRNLLGEFHDGIDAETNERVWGAHNFTDSIKMSDALSYYTESAKWLMGYAKARRIKSGSLILDWTGRPAQAEIMHKAGFESVQFIFNQGVPNGKRENPRTKRKDKPIVINPNPKELLYAHQVVENMISLGAWLLQQYIQSGRVRGLNEEMLKKVSDRDIDQELYSRKFENKISQRYGEIFNLKRKKEFRNQYGFSPDFFDVWCMAAYYMFVHRHMPISPITGSSSIEAQSNLQEDLEEHDDIWNDDLLP